MCFVVFVFLVFGFGLLLFNLSEIFKFLESFKVIPIFWGVVAKGGMRGVMSNMINKRYLSSKPSLAYVIRLHMIISLRPAFSRTCELLLNASGMSYHAYGFYH